MSGRQESVRLQTHGPHAVIPFFRGRIDSGKQDDRHRLLRGKTVFDREMQVHLPRLATSSYSLPRRGARGSDAKRFRHALKYFQLGSGLSTAPFESSFSTGQDLLGPSPPSLDISAAARSFRYPCYGQSTRRDPGGASPLTWPLVPRLNRSRLGVAQLDGLYVGPNTPYHMLGKLQIAAVYSRPRGRQGSRFPPQPLCLWPLIGGTILPSTRGPFWPPLDGS